MYQDNDIIQIKHDLKRTLHNGWGVSPEMQDYCGQSARIVSVNKDTMGFDTFTLDIDDGKFVWTKGMFEDVTNIDKEEKELLHRIESKVHGQHPVDADPIHGDRTNLLESTFGLSTPDMLGIRKLKKEPDELLGDYRIDKDGNLSDPVNHPSHYTDGSIEVIDFIEDKKLGYHLGNSVKYICRAGKKDPTKTIQDLKKCVWYVNRYIETLEK